MGTPRLVILFKDAILKSLEKALFIGPRGGKWADSRHTIPFDSKKHGKGKKIFLIDKTKKKVEKKEAKKKIFLIDKTEIKPVTEVLGEEKVNVGTKEDRPIDKPKGIPESPEQRELFVIPEKPKVPVTPQVTGGIEAPTIAVGEKPSTEGMTSLGTYQDGDVTAYWHPEHHTIRFIDNDTGFNLLGLTIPKVDTIGGAKKYASKRLGIPETPEKFVIPETPEKQEPGWERMPEAEQALEDAAEAMEAQAIPESPDTPETLELPAIPESPETFKIEPAKKLAREVGEHVWGSRADLAASVQSPADLEKLNPSEQATVVTKKNLMVTNTVEELLTQEVTPSAIVLRKAIEACIQSKPSDSLLERQDYMKGIAFVGRSLDGCKTAQEVEDFLVDWMHLRSGERLTNSYSASDMESIRQEFLKEHGIKETLSDKEVRALERDSQETWKQIRMAEIAKVSKKDKLYKDLIVRVQSNRAKIDESKKAHPQSHELLKWKLNISTYGGLSLHHGGDGSVKAYTSDPTIAESGDNAYDSMSRALGPRMINLVMAGGIYQTFGRTGGVPKGYKDARRLAAKLQEQTADEQLETLGTTFGKKGVGKPKIGREIYRWERIRPGEIDRVGGKSTGEADPDKLAQEFGFHHIQPGHYVTEGDADTHLRGIHGGLLDLADLMGVDPKLLGFKGTLSIAIGARGRGAAKAHYEPDDRIINITKIAGGGSLCHEWAHAMDHLVSVVADPKSTKAEQFLSLGEVQGATPEIKDAMQEVMAVIRYGGDTEALEQERRVKDIMLRKRKKEQLSWEERSELRRYQRSKPKKSNFFQDATALCGGAINGYWAAPTEMFARAFESFIEDTLEKRDRRSSYLVTGTTELYPTGKAGTGDVDAQPFPQGEERQRINTAMKKLLDVLREQKTLEKALQRFFILAR